MACARTPLSCRSPTQVSDLAPRHAGPCARCGCIRVPAIPSIGFNPQSEPTAILVTCNQLDLSRICHTPTPGSSTVPPPGQPATQASIWTSTQAPASTAAMATTARTASRPAPAQASRPPTAQTQRARMRVTSPSATLARRPTRRSTSPREGEYCPGGASGLGHLHIVPTQSLTFLRNATRHHVGTTPGPAPP